MRTVIAFGLVGGALILGMRYLEYRFLIVSHSFEIYGAFIAAAFASAGIWIGVKLTKGKTVRVEVPVPVSQPFVQNTARLEELGITPRELEVLQLIAEGLSTKEMAGRLFVSENTVKTHTGRVLEKLGASRRTQAVQLAKQQGIIA